jgi:hypothetical protein
MKRKKSKLDKAVARSAEIIEAHLETLSPAEAKSMLREIHHLAVNSSRSANRGKASPARRSAGLVLYPATAQDLHKF